MLAEEMSLAANGKKVSLQLMTAAKVCDYNHCIDCGYWLHYVQGDHIQHAMTVLDQGNGRDKILVYRAQGEDATPEEVVLSIQGYLVKAKMPPITQESEYVTCILSLCHFWYRSKHRTHQGVAHRAVYAHHWTWERAVLVKQLWLCFPSISCSPRCWWKEQCLTGKWNGSKSTLFLTSTASTSLYGRKPSPVLSLIFLRTSTHLVYCRSALQMKSSRQTALLTVSKESDWKGHLSELCCFAISLWVA